MSVAARGRGNGDAAMRIGDLMHGRHTQSGI